MFGLEVKIITHASETLLSVTCMYMTDTFTTIVRFVNHFWIKAFYTEVSSAKTTLFN